MRMETSGNNMIEQILTLKQQRNAVILAHN